MGYFLVACLLFVVMGLVRTMDKCDVFVYKRNAANVVDLAEHLESRVGESRLSLEDIDKPYRPLVDKFSDVVKDFTSCAATHSIPPAVCTECTHQYIALLQVFESLKHTNLSSTLNESCSRVIFRGYLVSYVNDLMDSLKTKIWEASKCCNCIENINITTGNYSIAKNATDYIKKWKNWTNCVDKFKSSNKTTICLNCTKQYAALYSSYWDAYVKKTVGFCVDIESKMNDTSDVWRKLYECKDPAKSPEAVVVVVLSGIFSIITIVFYSGSYVQGERKKRHLIKYSKLPEPQEQRTRLFSSSQYDDDNDGRFEELNSQSTSAGARSYSNSYGAL